MVYNSANTSVYLSHVQSDQPYADRLRQLLKSIGISVVSSGELTVGDHLEDLARGGLNDCSTMVVLIGPHTRDSRWVDMEIELGIRPQPGRPATGLLGIILENHEDFSRPYYDAEKVPPRLHDRVRWEYGLIKKWDENLGRIREWLDESMRRAQHYCPTVNLKTLRTLRTFQWNESIDTPRPVIARLLEEE